MGSLRLIVGAVSPLDGKAIVAAHALHVGVTQVGGAVFADEDARSKVIHHRSTVECAGGEVMLQTKDVPHLMTGQQRDTAKHDFIFRELRIGAIESGKQIEGGIITGRSWSLPYHTPE